MREAHAGLSACVAVVLAAATWACSHGPTAAPSTGDSGTTPDVDAGAALDAAVEGPGADARLEAAAEDSSPPSDGAADAALDATRDASACARACGGLACGPDGCGGTCGVCGTGTQCQSGQCVSVVCGQTCGAQEQCGWDPYQQGGIGAFGCIPQTWTTADCNGVGGIGTCDQAGNLQRCTPGGLVSEVCADGCGLNRSATSCGPLAACITCNTSPAYCAGAASAPICQDGLRIECYDNSYLLQWCAATGTSCQCPQGICACQ